MTSPSDRPKQLRGEALKLRIGVVVREMSLDIVAQSGSKTLSPKEIASRVPCSKTTVLKYKDYIDELLIGAKQRLSRRSGNAKVEALADRAHLLSKEVDALKAELLALRAHHGRIYRRLLDSSAKFAEVFRDDALNVSEKIDRCALCGGQLPQANQSNIHYLE